MSGIVFLVLFLSFSWSESGCTDPMAYNCSDDQDSTSYIIIAGGVPWDNSCIWSYSDSLYSKNEDNCNYEDVPLIEEDVDCLGYYNPLATDDDGSCKYYQTPSVNDVVFTIFEGDSIHIDWSLFEIPINANLESFHIQRCDDESCIFLPELAPNTSFIGTNITDYYDWEFNSYIKYVFFVRYEGYFWSDAVDYIYLVPIAGCMDPNDENYNPDANFDDGSCLLDLNYHVISNFKLDNAYPNPFNPNLTIEYSISTFDYINIDVVDINGSILDNLIDENLSSGNYKINWNASKYSSGIYFIRISSKRTGIKKEYKKVIYLK